MPSSYSLVFTLVLRGGYKDISEVIIIIFLMFSQNITCMHVGNRKWGQLPLPNNCNLTLAHPVLRQELTAHTLTTVS